MSGEAQPAGSPRPDAGSDPPAFVAIPRPRLRPQREAASSPRNGQADLLRKAVVSLERKLQEKVLALAAAVAECDLLRQHRERWQAGEAELAALGGEAVQLRREVEGRDCELARLRQHAEGLQANCSRLESEVVALQRQLADKATQLEQWRADREAAEVGCARAQSQQALAVAALAQLEAANEALRLDCREHSAKLRQAYEREAELLAEIGKLKEEQRCQAGMAGGRHEGQPKPTSRGGGGGGGDGDGHCRELEALHRDLFLAAAQHMLNEFSAKVAQAESKAVKLGAQLQAAEGRFGTLAVRCRSLQAQLESTSGRCARDEAAVQSVLASNMRLHEWVTQLMDQIAAGAATQQAKVACRVKQYQRPTQASAGRQQGSGTAPASAHPPDCSGCCWQCVCDKGGAASQQVPARRQLSTTGEAPATTAYGGPCPGMVRSLASSRQGNAIGATSAELGPHGCRGPRQQGTVAQQQQAVEAARATAVEAALAISTEYKELHKYYKAVVAEVHRVGNCLAVACRQESRQQLAAQQAELEKELWDVAEQLEVKMGQLTALKHAGLL